MASYTRVTDFETLTSAPTAKQLDDEFDAVQASVNNVAREQLVDGIINKAKMDTLSVGTNEVIDDSITMKKLALSAVGSAKAMIYDSGEVSATAGAEVNFAHGITDENGNPARPTIVLVLQRVLIGGTNRWVFVDPSSAYMIGWTWDTTNVTVYNDDTSDHVVRILAF